MAIPRVIPIDDRVASLEKAVAELEGLTAALERLLRITGNEVERQGRLLAALGTDSAKAVRASHHDFDNGITVQLAQLRAELARDMAAMGAERQRTTVAMTYARKEMRVFAAALGLILFALLVLLVVALVVLFRVVPTPEMAGIGGAMLVPFLIFWLVLRRLRKEERHMKSYIMPPLPTRGAP